ncbi:VOC family protein [Halomonas beimenensis]|uniref:Catechol 2,3-dioxygenase or other lactoylglutathione lyase family enzyme n=1 Tax=Halomonas beimenensis TaxID=475662 RepID=A0A291P6D4_9GAMM|nr:VOC family protein [Halomonas beimenensis]ATJ82456.1 catechol 2,3-dioxygenase or other lactoylglutathione lyase family enzyme [Halomonas beimenensis]
MRVQPLIAVEDIERSRRWYQRLFDCVGVHGAGDYEQLMMPGDDTFFLQLHLWEVHGHPNLEPAFVRPGHGVLLWFEVEEFDEAVTRARDMDAWIVQEPHVNARANHLECWLHDPDGYTVVLASPFGDVE